MPTKWVDMKALKQHISIEDVLAHYELQSTLQRKGNNLVGPCPIHKGTNPTQFRVSLEKNLFNCFGDCSGGGNALDLVRKMENVDIRAAALLICEWFDLSDKPEQSDTTESAAKSAAPAPAPPPEPKEERVREKTESSRVQEGNKPLTFSLQLNQEHPYIQERGFGKETAEVFGLGMGSRGLMKGRIAIPIHNEQGELVAYAGRWPSDPPKGEGKYKLPPNFQKSLVVYNLHRAKEHVRDHGLIVVEGYFDVMRLWQEAGLNNVVALMGSAMSAEQEALIVAAVGPQGKVILLFDEDSAGWAARADTLSRLAPQLFVKVLGLGKEGMQPDRLTAEDIRALGLLPSA